MLTKLTQSYLHTCEVFHHIRVYNGARSYMMGQSKLLHHGILGYCGVRTPPCVMIRDATQLQSMVAMSPLPAALRWPLLIKPNAGALPSLPLPSGRWLCAHVMTMMVNRWIRAWSHALKQYRWGESSNWWWRSHASVSEWWYSIGTELLSINHCISCMGTW